MRHLIYIPTFLASLLVAACAVPASKQCHPPVPSADKLLKDAGLPIAFWHKDVSWSGKTEDGSDMWIVSGDEMPKRMEDGECVARDYTWVLVTNPNDGHAALYSGEAASHNPEIGFFLNDDASKRSIACDHIEFKDYFLVGENISPHQAITLLHELGDAVECVKRGDIQCGHWQKLDIDNEKDSFLKLPELPVFMIEWEDRDVRDWIEIQYMLIPPTKESPYFIVLDCSVKILSDGSLELRVARGGPDP